MLKSILKTFAYIAFLAWSGIVCATGLGEINVSSYLGQPLKAQIALVSVAKADRSSISAKLASVEAFKNAGIDYPYALPKLKFEVANRDSGEPYIKVTSLQAVNEPFVTLLIEVSWSTGKLMREYTFLLDPADFNVQAPKAEAIKPIAPVVMAPAVSAVTPATTESAAPAESAVPAESAAPAEAPATPTAPVPASAEVAPAAQASEPQAESPAQPATTEAEPAAAQQKMAPTAEEAPGKTAAGAEAAPSQSPAAVEETVVDSVTVEHGDTLSKIALENKPADVSLDRMLVALYRANTDAFAGHNMNRLMAGKIIRMPEASELEEIKQSAAVKEVHAQVADWNAYRQQLASAHTAAPAEQAEQQEVSGKVTTAVAEKAPVAVDASKGVLKLSKGEAPGDAAVSAGKATAQDKANAKAEEAIAQSKALKEKQERAALLEKNVKDLQRLEDLKKTPVVKAASGVAAASAVSAAKTGVVAASGASAASAVAATVKPKAVAPKVVPPPAAVAETSLLDEVLGDPIKLAGIAAVLMILGGAGFVLVRRAKKKGSVAVPKPASAAAPKPKREKTSWMNSFRQFMGRFGKKKTETADKSVYEATVVRIAEPIAPSPDTGDFTKTAVVDTPAAASNPDEVDPIGEADLFLTFGRDAQAEAVLKEALTSNPGNIPVKLKLLSIYVTRKDANAFLGVAREIKDSGDDAAWNKAAAMGRELDPGNPLYGGTGPETGAEGKAKVGDASVDFDLGFGASNPAIKVGDDLMKTSVLEQQDHEKTSVLSADELRAFQATPMDFDVTGAHPQAKQETAEAVKPSSSLDELVFDITSSPQPAPGNAAVSAPAAGKPEETSLDDLIFDVTTSHKATPAAAAAPAPAPAAEENLSFSLDFPSEFNAEPAAKASAPVDIGLGTISLNLDNLTAPAASGGGAKDERWQEVATKLDLAKAYQEMGDAAGAKEILEEVLRDGDDQQRASAQSMLNQL